MKYKVTIHDEDYIILASDEAEASAEAFYQHYGYVADPSTNEAAGEVDDIEIIDSP